MLVSSESNIWGGSNRYSRVGLFEDVLLCLTTLPKATSRSDEHMGILWHISNVVAEANRVRPEVGRTSMSISGGASQASCASRSRACDYGIWSWPLSASEAYVIMKSILVETPKPSILSRNIMCS
jgi:hypothetical protein